VVCFSSAIVDRGGGSGKHFPFIRLGLSLFPSLSLSSPRQSKVLVQQGEQVPVKPPRLLASQTRRKSLNQKSLSEGLIWEMSLGNGEEKKWGGRIKLREKTKKREESMALNLLLLSFLS
jgi:hypothetical protein